MKRILVCAVAVTAVLAAGSCGGGEKLPGDENLGTWAFTAVPEAISCALADVPDAGFQFSGTYTRNRDGGQVFLTLNGVSRNANFDGQVVSSELTAARSFAECMPCTTEVQETLRVSILSRSQSEAAGNICPERPLDGGTPAPNDAGTITAPGPTNNGFDAVRACGELVDQVIAKPPAGGAACNPKCGGCSLRYRITGERK